MSDDELRKACNTCAMVKPASEFHTDRSREDGLTYRCRECTKEYHARPEVKEREAKRHQRTTQARPLFDIWRGIIRRCYQPDDPAFGWYGARGITMHGPWRLDYAAFEAGVTETIGARPSRRHSIDRVDTNGDYAPDNIRWATPVEQNRNRRDNHRVAYQGRTQVAAAWAREYGLNPTTFINRLVSGWDVERALLTPPRPIKPYVRKKRASRKEAAA